MSYLAFSRRWAGYLAQKTGLQPEKEEVLTYIIEVLAINLGNVLATLILGALLGVLPGTVACLLTVAILRHTAGGAHSNSPVRCALVTILLFPTMALIADMLSTKLNVIYNEYFMLAAILTALFAFTLLAPVASPSAPIISEFRRRKLKFLSIAAIILLSAAILTARAGIWDLSREIINSMILAILWGTFILTKPAHKMMTFIDRITIK